jgi:hypothetical protein
LIEDTDSDRALVIQDIHDYQLNIRKSQKRLSECFSQSQINLHSCYAHDEWQNCLQRALYGDTVDE